MNRTVNLNQLVPNTTILVRGKLAYSRLARQIDGEELQKDMSRRQQKGWIPIEKPYTTATINNAAVIPSANGQKGPADIYVEEHFYQSRSNQATGWSFTANNKGKNLPWVAEMQGTQAIQVIPEGELANGLDVTLVLRVFKGKPNNGLSLDGVIVNEPIRYFNGTAGAGLADMGITFVPAANAPKAPAAQPAPAPAVAPAAAPAGFPADENPFGTPVTAPAGNPYAAAPAPAGMPFGAPQQQGIRYNPNSDRPY